MRRCAPNFCQDLGEASELTTNAQRVASALHVYRAHTERIQGAHVKKIQRMHSVLLAHETNGPRMHHAFNAQPANGSGHVTVRLACHTRHIFWGGSCRHNQQERPSSPMRVGGEVMMIPHGYTLCTRLEHARRTLGALQIRSALV